MDKPCMYYNPSDYEWDEAETCSHPLLCHITGASSNPITANKCQDCPGYTNPEDVVSHEHTQQEE